MQRDQGEPRDHREEAISATTRMANGYDIMIETKKDGEEDEGAEGLVIREDAVKDDEQGVSKVEEVG